MVIGNRLTEIGDFIIIKSLIPVVGVTGFISYSDITYGETGSSYFNRQFRYSLDSVNYSDWIDLTNGNLQAIAINPENTFFIEYRYERAGTDISGDLWFESINIQANQINVIGGPIHNQSVFTQFFGAYDVEILNWCISMFEKIYKKGIVPNFITRGENSNVISGDEDYISYWRTICCFWSLFVNYARLFENIKNTDKLLLEYINQKGLIVRSNESNSNLNILRTTFYNEIRRRGTLLVSKSSGYGNLVIDGELLRLIEWKDTDEFFFALTEAERFGWCLDNSSPMYRGVEKIDMFEKGYESGEDVVDLDNYDLTDLNKCTLVSLGGKDCIQISAVAAGNVAGIGDMSGDRWKKFVVNPYLSYELSFFVNQSQLTDNITSYLIAFDENCNQMLLKNYTTGSISNDFFTRKSLNQTVIWYQVRLFIYGIGVIGEEMNPSIGYGNHLQFANSNTRYLCPQIYLDNTLGIGSSSAIHLWNIKIRPLKTNYDRGFLQSSNLIQAMMKNNSHRTSQEIENFIREYLIPYNSRVIYNYLT